MCASVCVSTRIYTLVWSLGGCLAIVNVANRIRRDGYIIASRFMMVLGDFFGFLLLDL